MTIYLGADHRGFDLKQALIPFLTKKKHTLVDCSPVLKAGDDYPIIARKVARRVLTTRGSVGLLICGSGDGMDIAANRLKGIRAVVCRSPKEARLARHDDASNILVLGADLTSPASARRIVCAWLDTPVSTARRHQRRVKELDYL